jgi:hypothetical protein
VATSSTVCTTSSENRRTSAGTTRANWRVTAGEIARAVEVVEEEAGCRCAARVVQQVAVGQGEARVLESLDGR